MKNADTLYLWDQHCLVRNSVCFLFLFVCPCMSLCQLLITIKWYRYISVKLALGLRYNTKCCFKLFKNPHKNWGSNNEIMVRFELAFLAIIVTGVARFQFQTILSAHTGVGTWDIWGIWLFLSKFVPLHTEKYFGNFINITNVRWV